MTKAQALKNFFSGFKLPAYPSTAVPDNVTFPYLTYENKLGNFGDVFNITVDLYYHTTSESAPNNKAEEISKALGLGGVQLACDDGLIWLKRGTPWSTALVDGTDSTFKRRMLNVTAEFI